jgi:hypothetical protein
VPVNTGDCYKIRVGGWDAGVVGAGLMEIACESCRFDADCSDGLFCTGTETCDGGRCLEGQPPCTDQFCDEVDDACLPFPAGDVDRDGDVDLDDAAVFVPCMSGPGIGPAPCAYPDVDLDDDVDLADLAAFQIGFGIQLP